MMQICPRCGDYFAGDAPPFCPADGSPLAQADPRADGWEDGEWVVREKSERLRRQTRRVRLRRVVVSMTTVIVTTMVVLVIVANTVVYLRPEPEAPALVASAVKPSTAPARDPVRPSTSLPTGDTTLLLPLLPTDTPTPPPDAAESPDPSRPSTPTPTPEDTSTPQETQTPTPTPEATPTYVEPPPRTPTPTPTPTPTRVITSTPPPPPPPPAPTCTDDDKRALRAAITMSNSGAWEEAIGRERVEIGRAFERGGAARVSVTPFGPIVYSVNISKTCVPVSVVAVYVWRVRWAGAPAQDRPDNREPRQREPRQSSSEGGERRMFRTKTFPCWGGGSVWRCY